jgi:pimeloyl-ACP methyl ester carboxylesterase
MLGVRSKGKKIMKVPTKAVCVENINAGKPVTIYTVRLVICLVVLLLTFRAVQAQAEWPHVVPSKDGTPISYEIYGVGEPTLVFVHGWSCDARYWRAQLSHFTKNHRVVLIDLAGHGHSGSTRSQYTMKSFGEDVQAVTEATGSRRVILIGHSMGGSVIAEAARLMPNRVIGLIGIDTLENIEYPMTREALDQMIAPLTKDFRTGSRQFVKPMILPSTDPQLREWILSDMSAAAPAVALSAMNEMMSQYITKEAAAIFDEIRIPVITVNGDLWPINYEANRRHMFSFNAIVLKDADHFLMMDRKEEFNRALEKAIDTILIKPVK